MGDDLSQRLWRAGAREAWQAEQSLERAWEFAQRKEDDAETWFSAFASWRKWALEEFTRLKKRAEVAAAHIEGDCSSTERLLDEYTEEIRKQGAKIDSLTEELELLKDEAEAHSGVECMAIAHALEEAERLLDEREGTISEQIARTVQIQDMLSYLDLHMAKYPITQLATEQKELYADLVDAGSLRSWEEDAATDRDDPEDQPRTMERWWR